MKNVIFTILIVFLGFTSFAQQKSFDVKIIGKGKPVVLIPGYSCSGDVWKETADHLKNKYQLHILTLAGYAGTKPIDSPILQTVHNEIIAYVKTNKLNKPIVKPRN